MSAESTPAEYWDVRKEQKGTFQLADKDPVLLEVGRMQYLVCHEEGNSFSIRSVGQHHPLRENLFPVGEYSKPINPTGIKNVGSVNSSGFQISVRPPQTEIEIQTAGSGLIMEVQNRTDDTVRVFRDNPNQPQTTPEVIIPDQYLSFIPRVAGGVNR